MSGEIAYLCNACTDSLAAEIEETLARFTWLGDWTSRFNASLQHARATNDPSELRDLVEEIDDVRNGAKPWAPRAGARH